MFEAVELGRKVTKKEFDAAEPELRTSLLEAQRDIQKAGIPVIILVSGVEGAGKGDVLNRLNKWLDTRGVHLHAFWDHTDEELERPRYWRFWRQLPPAGTVGVMFGSWYKRPIVDRVFDRIGKREFEHELRRIEEFERLLTRGGALIVKFWFHLGAKQQRKRLQEDLDSGRLSSPLLEKHAKRYDEFVRVSERAIRMTDVGRCPWHLVEATDKRFRDLTVGQTLLRALQERLAAAEAESTDGEASQVASQPALGDGRTILDKVDLSATLEEEDYHLRLKFLQHRLKQLGWDAREKKRSTIVLFEGWDAGGKGGAIRRITQAVDARLYKTISVSAPTDEERAHHYLWRFWRHLPRAGYMTLYDRSWYGRVLVERIEGFAKQQEWQRAYQEINDFEEQLVEGGIVVLKFWIHISNEEQLRRFKEREQIPWKKHKITEEDWRNREKWSEYEIAVNEMVGRTSTDYAPWHLIPGNDKKVARVQVLEHLCARLEKALKD